MCIGMDNEDSREIPPLFPSHGYSLTSLHCLISLGFFALHCLNGISYETFDPHSSQMRPEYKLLFCCFCLLLGRRKRNILPAYSASPYQAS